MVEDLLKYNLPTSLWAHGKEAPPNESVFALNEIEGEIWFDERMRKCCLVSIISSSPPPFGTVSLLLFAQKYNLSVEDIYQMRATWDGIQAGSYDFFAPVDTIWDYMVLYIFLPYS